MAADGHLGLPTGALRRVAGGADLCGGDAAGFRRAVVLLVPVRLGAAHFGAHGGGIRPVPPEAELITDNGAARLTDFGISYLAGDPRITQPGVISDTFAYLAPEAARTGVSSPSSDVFALGCTLYAAIEGQPPLNIAGTTLEQLRIIAAGIIRPPGAAGALTPLLLRLLEPEPAVRPDAATARDLLA